MKGYIQVYTGNGKGKSTAAFGLALRGAGAGLRIYIGQFLKGSRYSELESIKKLSGLITLKQYGRTGFIRNHPSTEDIAQAKAGLHEIKEIVRAGHHQIVILDEVNVAISYNLLSVEDLLEVMDRKHPSVELVFTGRDADQKIIDRADLVTEMKEIKHYYRKGVPARVGIEK